MESSSANRIVCILPRGEAIRNFVYTGTLDLLQQKRPQTVLSVRPSDEIWRHMGSRCGDLRPLQGFENRYPVRILREVLDLAHGRFLWSEASKERWRLRDQEASNIRQKMKRYAKKAAGQLFASRRGIGLLSRAERITSRSLRTTRYYVDLLRELDPSLVFNCSHVHSHNAIHAVEAAQWLGIKTATFIFSWDNLTSQGRIMPPYDYYLVWNEAIRDQLLDIYDAVRPQQVFVTGTPQFDFHFRSEFFWTREEFCERIGADPLRPIVLYSTGMANHMPGEPEIVEGIAKLLSKMTDLGLPQLVVRVYPKDRSRRFDEVQRRYPEVIFPVVPWEEAWLTPSFEDTYQLVNMLRHATVGINVASTVSLELCMFDKPVINVGYNPPSVDKEVVDYMRYYDFDHYRPLVQSGAVMLAKSELELCSMLRDAIINPSADTARRQNLIKGMFGKTLDGHSATRVADRLLDLAGSVN
jgi:hypothetical protein